MKLSVWEETFNSYPVSSVYQEAFEIFASKFDDILKISCSLSLAALSEDLLGLIQKSLDWKYIKITSQSISIDIEKWKKVLKSQKLDSTRINNLVNKFEEYLQITNNHNIEISRWLSHGHIGLNFIFAVYGQCLYIAALSKNRNSDEEANKINTNKDMRFSLSTKAWINNNYFDIKDNKYNDFPIKCFNILIENNL